MGSGLILFVIVGTWLAVLVPMGLRSHDGHSSRSVERLGEAVRVLVRRSARADSPEELPAPEKAPRRHRLRGAGDAVLLRVRRGRSALTGRRRQPLLARSLTLSRAVDWVGRLPVRHARQPGTATGSGHRLLAPLAKTLSWHRVSPAVSPAVRRRRLLFVLLLVAFGALLAGQVGPGWLHAVGGAALTLALLVVVNGRRHAAAHADRALRRAERQAELRRGVTRHRPASRRADARPAVHPVAVERRPATLETAAPVRTAATSPAAVGHEWQPVPVPLPTYVGKAVAPPRPAAVAELPVEQLPPDEPAIDEPAEESDDILERRRAVGGW